MSKKSNNGKGFRGGAGTNAGSGKARAERTFGTKASGRKPTAGSAAAGTRGSVGRRGSEVGGRASRAGDVARSRGGAGAVSKPAGTAEARGRAGGKAPEAALRATEMGASTRTRGGASAVSRSAASPASVDAGGFAGKAPETGIKAAKTGALTRKQGGAGAVSKPAGTAGARGHAGGKALEAAMRATEMGALTRTRGGASAVSRSAASPGRPQGRGRQQAAADLSGLPVEKNGEYEADIVGIGHEGEGVGRVSGYTLFIPGALPGERVLVKALKLKKQYGYGKLLKIIKASPDRIAAPCPIYSQCGGCQLQHLSYDAQLRFKRQLVIDNLERIGKLKVAGERTKGFKASDEVGSEKQLTERSLEAQGKGTSVVEVSRTSVKSGSEEPSSTDAGSYAANENRARLVSEAAADRDGILVHPTLGMNDPWRYRNKAQVPIGFEAASTDREGGLVGGFYAQGSHRIIDMEACLIQQENNDLVVAEVKRVARELGIRAYNEETHKGLLRHVVARYGFNTGEIMVVLITNGESLPHADELVGLLREAIPGLKSICQNINKERTNVIFGDKTKVLWGDDVIYDTIGDIRFAISARSFYQVNPVQTEVLYGKALDFAGLSGEETVIDAYCGIGTISLFLAQRARQVYGVEIVGEAIDDARRNARLNGIRNVQFETGAAEVVIPAWRRQGIAPDVIVVDPPRKGCDAALLETILAMRPARVVYVSCNPSTLARDLHVLEEGGYSTVEVQPVDMFPHTVHVESVALLVRDETEG